MTASNPKSEIRNPKSSLPPPQFGLRTLLLVVTFCAVLAAASQWLSPIAIAAIVFLVLSIIAHVAGNSIGTRLRELGSQTADNDVDRVPPRAKPRADQFAPATRLGQRHALGWPIVIATLAGIIAGGVGGGLWTLLTSRGSIGPLNVGVGCVAFAVLGGLAAFTAFGFIQVGWGAMRQALSQSPASQPSRPVSSDKPQ